MNQASKREYAILLALVVVVGGLLVATTIKGPFIIDEINYLVTATSLSEGRLTVSGTEGLSPSKELYSFDPEAFGRIPARTPVSSLAPPLYAPFALPFLAFGWRGLVFLNTISFLLTGILVFAIARRHQTQQQTAWLALALALAGGYGIEYAQGVWPHMFSVFLVTLSVYIADLIWQEGRPAMGVLCGLLMGVATGVREQNIVLTAFLGLTILLYANRRILATTWYAFGAAVPLAAITAINVAREHLWHPFPKVVAFGHQVPGTGSGRSILWPIRTFWARFVDFSAHTEITYPIQADIYKQNPNSGAFLVLGTLKKALIQSSPWIGVAFVILILVWLSSRSLKKDIRRSLMGLSLLIFPLVALFSLAWPGRTDGLAYNQRYLLEMIPLAALAVALALDRLELNVLHVCAGVLAAGLLYAVVLMAPSHTWYEIALLKIPLILSLLLALGWVFQTRRNTQAMIATLLGLCLGWSLLVHVFDDLPASRHRRQTNADQLALLEKTVPNHSALLTYLASKDVAGPLHITHDVVILDASADEGADAATLIPQLRRQGRRILIMADLFPPSLLNEICGHDSVAVLSREKVRVIEVIGKFSPIPSTQ